jgi:hypothetical protein
MAKIYMNFKGKQGIETVGEYDLDRQPTPGDIELYLREGNKPTLSNQRMNRWMARYECAEANRTHAGHYLSTRCTKAWSAK